MKRALWLTVVCITLVFMMAGVAFANTNSGDGQTQTPYADWSNGGANAAVPSPHAGYDLNTVKCAVCHAVHKGPANGQILLRDTAANACVYCHIQTSVGNVQLYNANLLNYTTDTNNNHSSLAGCQNCHTVHGANAIQSAAFPDVTARILKQQPGGYSVQATATADGYTYASGTRANVITAFCTTCHPYFVGSYEETHAGSLGTGGSFKGHILTGTINNYSNPNRGGGVPAQVAFASSAQCRSCHDDGGTQEGAGIHADNYPHMTTGARFENAATATVGAVSPATNPLQDGVCLKCHSNGAAGVNMTF